MKKVLQLILASIILSPATYAQTKSINYSDFFITKQGNTQEYQQYKGATIAFYEQPKSDKAMFNLDEIELGAPYIIKSIQVYYALGIPRVDMTISKKGVKGGKDIRIKCINGESTNKNPGFDDFPAYFFEPVKRLEDEFLGRTVVVNGYLFSIAGIALGDQSVSFVFKSDNGFEFEELVNVALGVDFEDSLVSVEKPENDAVQYGETRVITDRNLTRYSYVDNIISIVIDHNESEFNFSILNLSDNTLKIIWDEAAFVGVDGSTSKVIHSGIKYNDREKAQIPSIIVKGSSLEDIVVPVNNIVLSNNTWDTLPMYLHKSVGNVALLLPIQIKGVTNEYIFVFQRKLVQKYPELHSVL